MQIRRFAWLWPLLLLLSAALAACGGGEQEKQPTPTPEGTAETAEVPGPLPQDFPEDFPLYPNVEISQSARFGYQILMTLNSEDSPRQVVEFYREALSQPPWELLAEQEVPEQGLTVIRFQHSVEPIRGAISVAETEADGRITAITLRMMVPELMGTPVPRSPFTPAPANHPNPGGGVATTDGEPP